MTVSRREIDDLRRQVGVLRAQGRGEFAPQPEPRNIVEFATSNDFLGLNLFPGQATILKCITVATHAFTAWDFEFIDRLAAGFIVTDDGGVTRWQGSEGTPGDLLQRIEWCRAQGRRWFGEVLLVVGRRGSKNFLGAIVGAWVTWHILNDQTVATEAGVKTVTIPVYAGKKQQAVDNQFRDLARLITTASCFGRYIANVSNDRLALYSQAQLEAPTVPAARDAALQIRAGETTMTDPRGPAAPMVFFDEFAHLQGAGSTANSTYLYAAAVPSLAQFDKHSIVLQTSSPWDRDGQLFESYQRALAIDSATGLATEPDMLAIQVPSWVPYEGWERSETIEMWPGGPNFAPWAKPMISFNDRLRRQQAANPDSFAVEYLAQWRSSQLAYFPAAFIDRVFAAHNGAPLQQQTDGIPKYAYAAHGDPSKSQAGFGFAIGHLEPDTDGIDHVLFDVITCWDPARFPGHIVDYRYIKDEIFGYITRFNITTLTFDQFNSLEGIQDLQARADRANSIGYTHVFERTATTRHNYDSYEIMKTAIGHGSVHAPRHALARAELEALQLVNGKVTTATTGPTRTKDVADAMANVVYSLIGENHAALFERIASLPPRGMLAGGMPLPTQMPTAQEQMSAAGRAMNPYNRFAGGGERRGDIWNPARGARFGGHRRRQ